MCKICPLSEQQMNEIRLALCFSLFSSVPAGCCTSFAFHAIVAAVASASAKSAEFVLCVLCDPRLALRTHQSDLQPGPPLFCSSIFFLPESSVRQVGGMHDRHIRCLLPLLLLLPFRCRGLEHDRGFQCIMLRRAPGARRSVICCLLLGARQNQWACVTCRLVPYIPLCVRLFYVN